MKETIKIFSKTIFLFIIFFSTHVESKILSIGNSDAKVIVKVFSSLTCPHCANFHIKIVPKIIKEYVEAGKVQLQFMDFPLDQASFNASKLLHCIDQNKQLEYLDTIYENQAKWTSGEDIDQINNNLKIIVESLGISSDKFSKCLINETISDKILNLRIEAHKEYSIDSTPTVVINEKKLKGSATLNNIIRKIEKII